MSDAERLRFRLYGLPEEWYNRSLDTTALSTPEKDRLKSAFNSVRVGVCYIQGNAGPIANMYLKQGVKVRGVNMAPRINDPFEKEEHKGLPSADVVFLYNVDEGTTGVTLTQKVIKKVIQFYTKSMVVLVGERNGRTFAKDIYNIKNYCSIPEPEEEKWL